MGRTCCNPLFALLALAIFLVPLTGRTVSTDPPALTIPLSNGGVAELTFSTEPAIADCRQIDSPEGSQLWECSQYSLELNLHREQGSDQLGFAIRSRDGGTFNLHGFTARVVIPCSEDDALWSFNRLPVRDIMETNLSRPWEYYSAANRGIPLLALVDRQGLNRLAMGLLGQDHSVLTRGELSGDRKDCAITLRQIDDATAESFEDAVYISGVKDPWYRIAQAYTTAVDLKRNYVPPPMPEAALYPTYDSWYWTTDRINQDLVWKLATRSRDLGFKTYLVDAGWDTHAGQYSQWLNGSTGDYTPPPEAFRNFSGLLDDIRTELGMKVMLWMQQYALGRRSFYYPEVGSLLTFVDGGPEGTPVETPALCPMTDATRQHMIQLFSRVLSDYRPDALWFDWQEDIPQRCDATHFHDYARFGEGYNATQQAITDSIRQLAPDAFVDMRWPFANLNNKPYSHIWQPIDSSEDFEAMRLRAMIMRPFSAGVVIGTDEMYWKPTISDTEAARFMATVVFTGVPYFGPNIQAESPARAEMLRSWLRFYEENKEDLVWGDFSPYGNRDRPDQFIEGQQAVFIYSGSSQFKTVRLKNPSAKLYMVNTSTAPNIDLLVMGMGGGNYRLEISDLLLRNQENPAVLNLRNNNRLRLEIPTGCLATLTRIPSLQAGSMTRR